MAEKYVEKIKSASSGEIYTIRDANIDTKQDLLVSGTNIKTINNQSILGSGNIDIQGGTGAVESVNNKTGKVTLTASDVGAATEAQGAKADTAVQPAAIADMETQTHASSTYQTKLTSANAGTNVTITEESGVVKISAAGGSGGASTFAELQGQPTDNANLAAALNAKQETLVSGTNIKSINNTSLLGEGNVEVLTSSDVGTMAAEDKTDYFTKTEVTDGFLPNNLGSENIGKYVKVGSDGDVVTETVNIPDVSNYYTKTEVDNEFLPSNLGSENAGKVLKIDTDGSIISAEVAGSTVDDEMSTVSTNPVQNKVITEATNSNTSRVTDLEDQLYDNIEHSEEIITQNWMTKGSSNYYTTSTFSGWLGSIGRPDKIGWVEFVIRGRGAETPITWVRCRVYKMTRDLVESDYTYTEGSSTPYSNPILGTFTTKIVDKTLNFDEDPITGNRTVRFDLDEIIDNTEEHCQYLVGYNCNNLVSGGDRIQNGGTSPYGEGFTGPWIAYTTWNGTTTGNDFDSTVLSTTRGLNLTGNAYNNEHLATPKYHIMEAKVGYINEWTEREITTDPDGKVGTIVQGVIEEMGIQEQLDAAIAATELVQLTSIVEYQGSSSLNLVENPTTGYTYVNPDSTFDGECFPIGPVPAEVPIGGFRVPLGIRSYSPDTDAGFRTANIAKVELWACDYTMENNTTVWSDPEFGAVKVAEKAIDIDLDLDNPEKLNGVYDFIFDEPFYNTEGKHLYLAYFINARIYRPKATANLLTYLNTTYSLGLTSVKSFYSAFSAKQTTAPANIGKSNRWGNDKVIAFSIITAHDGYIASDKFNEWVDERTSGTIVQEVEDYLDTHSLPVPPSYEVRLAKKYYAVVGDKLQLFYDGLIKGINPSQIADITVRCSKGKNYPRYWEWTPAAEDAGNSYSFKLYVRNFQGEIVSQGQTTIEVLTVPTYSEATTYNMLGFGDSLTSSGAWFGEGMRRLVGTDSSAVGPASLQVPNLTLSSYGKKHNTVNTFLTYHEGYGGWTWGSFLSTTGGGSTVNGIFVTLDHTVTWDLDTVQHSVWVDQNNKNWVLEDIDGAKIKFDRGSGNNASQSNTQLPTNLHCSTLSLDITQTEISNATWESGNPFYDDDTGRVNFVAHAQELGHAPADIVSILLTWNGGGGELDFNYQSKITAHMNNATTLLRDIHSDLPNAKIICVGIQLPSITGGAGANYDANGGYADQNATYYYAYDYNKALENLVTNEEFGSYCYYVDTKGQFDTKYLMSYDMVAVNTRSTATEMRGTNGVHPSTNGYYAIGDAYFRTLVKVLNDLQA